jgi:hypothetical protein
VIDSDIQPVAINRTKHNVIIGARLRESFIGIDVGQSKSRLGTPGGRNSYSHITGWVGGIITWIPSLEQNTPRDESKIDPSTQDVMTVFSIFKLHFLSFLVSKKLYFRFITLL